jgi:hypothetical protein
VLGAEPNVLLPSSSSSSSTSVTSENISRKRRRKLEQVPEEVEEQDNEMLVSEMQNFSISTEHIKEPSMCFGICFYLFQAIMIY